MVDTNEHEFSTRKLGDKAGGLETYSWLVIEGSEKLRNSEDCLNQIDAWVSQADIKSWKSKVENANRDEPGPGNYFRIVVCYNKEDGGDRFWDGSGKNVGGTVQGVSESHLSTVEELFADAQLVKEDLEPLELPEGDELPEEGPPRKADNRQHKHKAGYWVFVAQMTGTVKNSAS